MLMTGRMKGNIVLENEMLFSLKMVGELLSEK